MSSSTEVWPPLPPFTRESAIQKVRMAKEGGNRDPQRVSLVYTQQSQWRNHGDFPRGRAEIAQFAMRKWARERDNRLIKERQSRIAVRVAQEWHDDSGTVTVAFGNENWEADDCGLMRYRYARSNDLPINESER